MHAECSPATAPDLERYARERAATQAQHTLERDLHDQVVALRRSHHAGEQELGHVIELRDYDIAAHVARVGELAADLAAAAGLDASYCTRIRAAAPLHDIGKLAVPDSILLKPGPLSDAEWEIMRAHAAIGWSVLRRSSSPTIRLAAVIAYTHHERCDGLGYPRRLAGDAIPLPGRLVAVCDAFDALTNVRPYRPALTNDAALERMLDSPGQFDPRLLALFCGGATPCSSRGARVRAGRAPLR